MDALQNFKKQYPVVAEQPVQWGDMDAFNHVNNTVYFRWFETARIKYFEKMGLMAKMKDDEIGPISASTDARFKAAVSYPDTIYVGAKVTELNESYFIHEYAVFSKKLNRITTTGTGRCVLFDYTAQTKSPVTKGVAEAIHTLEETGTKHKE